MMYLERFRWGDWTKGEELSNALQRGFLPAVYEYVYLTGDRDRVKREILGTLGNPLIPEVRRKLLWLLRVLDRLRFREREDGWIMVMLPGKVVGWLKREE